MFEASTTDKKLGFSTTSRVIWLSFRPDINHTLNPRGKVPTPQELPTYSNLKCTCTSVSNSLAVCPFLIAFPKDHYLVLQYMYGELRGINSGDWSENWDGESSTRLRLGV